MLIPTIASARLSALEKTRPARSIDRARDDSSAFERTSRPSRRVSLIGCPAPSTEGVVGTNEMLLSSRSVQVSRCGGRAVHESGLSVSHHR